MRRPQLRSALPIAFAVVSCAVALAACGSSGKPKGGSRSAAASVGIRYSECMRAHGVPNFPDPTSVGAGVQLLGGAGVNTQSPAFASAQNACQKLLPGGTPGPGSYSATQIKQGVKLAACMRAHGLRSFPDPTDSPPSGPPGPHTTIVGGPDGVFTLTGSIVTTPGFKRAAARCHLPGFGLGSGRGFAMPVAPSSG
jgi:hypothetical protein